MATARSSWLIGPVSGQEPQSFNELVACIAADPEVRIVRSIESSDQSRLVVAEMTDEASKRYQEEYREQLHFEPNETLELFAPMNE